MSPEERELLEKSVSLSEENNKMLHAMRRSMFWAHVSSVLYWLVIIGISVGAFYYLEPYVEKAMNLYNSISNVQQKLNTNSSSLGDLLKKL